MKEIKDLENEIRNGKWIKFNECTPKDVGLDWVLVQFVEKDTEFVGVPYVAELQNKKGEWKWNLQCDDYCLLEYINTKCYASSWKIIEKSPEFLASELGKPLHPNNKTV